MSSSRLLAGLIALLVPLLVPMAGHALVIKSVKITIDSVKGDAFAIKGELGPLDHPPAVEIDTPTAVLLRSSCAPGAEVSMVHHFDGRGLRGRQTIGIDRSVPHRDRAGCRGGADALGALGHRTGAVQLGKATEASEENPPKQRLSVTSLAT